MKATKIASFVVLCIAALAVVSSIGIMVMQTLAPRLELKSFKDGSINASLIGNASRPMGDPIDDPRPNRK